MKRALAVLLLVTMGFFSLLGCSNDAEKNQLAAEKIEKRKEAYKIKELGKSDIPVTTNNF
ncbi:hypothetical protein [Halodesulfovibrio aestuarii]|uniref:Uncharacterized protein n=1 Tax=Halodesulfovibrio aestuarii TaxID=126333 RepID=A0ABV4JWK5_9BACT